jgi:phosphate transport system substrate-binding protein
MAKRSGPPPIVFILLGLGVIGAVYWGVTQFLFKPNGNTPITAETGAPGGNPPPGGNAPFTPPTSVPSGTTVRIDGSTSMVSINQALKQSFEQQFPGTKVISNAQGSSSGIQALLGNQVDVAASSRPLSSTEKSQGLAEIVVTEDAIAIIVGDSNPFRKGLSKAQVIDIFTGRITDWSQVGGPAAPLRAINRPAVSGTRQAFQEIVLQQGEFGPNLETLDRDATTPLIRALQGDGISYATYRQVANQRTARTVPIDGLTPEAASYPLKRPLYYVYRTPPNPAAQAFLGHATSPLGRQVISSAN